MINLLPPAEKKEIRAGYSNVLLIRYTLLTVGALVFVILALGVTYFVLMQAQTSAESTTRNNQEKAIDFRDTQAAATKFRDNLSSAEKLFTNDVRYSKVLIRLAQALPDGTAISSLSIDDSSFTAPVALEVNVRGRSAAEALESSLGGSPFVSSVTLGSIRTNQDSSSYPYTADVTVTLDRSIGK